LAKAKGAAASEKRESAQVKSAKVLSEKDWSDAERKRGCTVKKQF
jgi:hypothetical protein